MYFFSYKKKITKRHDVYLSDDGDSDIVFVVFPYYFKGSQLCYLVFNYVRFGLNQGVNLTEAWIYPVRHENLPCRTCNLYISCEV